MSDRFRGMRGFTLAELLVGMAVAAIVLVAAGLAFQFASGTLASGSDQADVQQNARWVLERLVQEMRGAGYDPRATRAGATFDAIANAFTNSVILQSDLNGNGILDPQGVCDSSAVAEKVSYRVANNEIRRATDPPANGCESVIVGGVSALTFAYFDVDGNTTAVASAVRTIEVTVELSSQSGGYERKATATDRVRLRNR